MKQQTKENPRFIVSMFLALYILLSFLVHIIFLEIAVDFTEERIRMRRGW